MYLSFVSASFWVACIFQSICPFHLMYEHKTVNSGLLFFCHRVCNEALFFFLLLVICVFYFLVWLARGLAILLIFIKYQFLFSLIHFVLFFYLIDFCFFFFCSYFYISFFRLRLGLSCSLNKFLR